MAPPPGKPKNQGQWALGDREPLNPNEVFKAADDGLNVRDRIIDTYSSEGFASIPPEDLRGRMRWWGLYTQRKPGIPGGKTASLPPEELDDEFFMLRVRIDGGALNAEQIRAIAGISQDFARDTADISDRENIQLHWIRIEDVPEIWRRLEAVGLSTTEACGDTPRVILGSPVAGVAADEIIDGTPAIDEIVSRYIGSPEYSNLPRKFKTAISGSPRQDVAHEVNDVSFLGVVHPEHGPGFDLWVGGGLSTAPKFAVRLGVWVPLTEVPEVWTGVIGIFRDYGYRRMRTKARLKFLVAEWGAEKFREVLETEYLHRRLHDGPPPPPPAPGARDHVGVHPQKDGNFYVGAAPTVGRSSGTILAQVADLAERHGSGRIRLTPYQKLVVLDVPAANVEPLIEGLAELGLRARPSVFRQSAMACTGIEFCKLAITETKGRADELVTELERRLPDFGQPLAIHVNGCPNSCARFQVADIGLKGVLVPHEGEQVEGFQVHLGGSLGEESGFGKSLRGHRLAADELADYVERLLINYTSERTEGETFAQWTTRAAEEVLAMTVQLALAKPRRAQAELRDILSDAATRFSDDSDPLELMRWFGDRLGVDRIGVAVSFSDGVMACLGAKALPGVDLLFGDTGYHFTETLGLREAVQAIYPVNVRSLEPELTVAEQDHQYGENLWERNPDLCCAMRKTAPMDAALRGYDAWATGLRRSDHAGRADTPMFHWDERHAMIKVNPIAAMTDEHIDACIEKYGILENPLRQIGYRSIGCSPCTRPILDGEDERSGRWSGRTKVECGLHL